MSFSSTGLILLAHGANEKIFKYVSAADAIATIMAADYFLTRYEQFQAGDLIIIEDSTGELFFAKVSAASSTTVTLQAVNSNGAVETISLTTSVISAHGITHLTFGASKTVQLAAPYAGARKVLTKTTGASTIVVTVSATDASANFDGGTKQTLVFTMTGSAALLFGVSATRWVVVGGSALAALVDPVIT